MSEQSYTLLSWNGQVHGSFSATEIKRLWETEEISGLYQVVTDQGNLSVQEFVALVEDATEKNRHYQEQLALAEAEEQRVLQAQMRAEAAQAAERIEPEGSHKPKSKGGVSLSDKIYYIFLDEEKKGPFSKQNLQVMYRAGRVDDDTQVWTEDLGEWVELKGFEEVVGSKSRPALNSIPLVKHNQSSGPGREYHKTYDSKPTPQTPVSLIFWGWFLGTVGPFCFAFLVGFILALLNAPQEFAVVLALVLHAGSSITAFVISIILVCSPSNTGRVNGIILLVLFVLSGIFLLLTGGRGIYN
jgi:hypothetical protein